MHSWFTQKLFSNGSVDEWWQSIQLNREHSKHRLQAQATCHIGDTRPHHDLQPMGGTCASPYGPPGVDTRETPETPQGSVSMVTQHENHSGQVLRTRPI